MAQGQQLGDVVLWTEARRLTRQGRELALGSRAFDLLSALAQQPGRTWSREQLIEQVWPGLVVEENNLSVQVSTLRKLLGASAIKTLPGKGYRLTLTPHPVQAADLPPPAPAEPALPLAPAFFVGRQRELQRLATLLQSGSATLVSICGPGGMGKSSLALAAAHAWQGGGRPVYWLALEQPCTRDELVARLARCAGLPQGDSGAPAAALLAALRQSSALVLLDGAEAALAAVRELVDLLSPCTRLHLLVTSQLPLRHPREKLLRLEGLSVPPPQPLPAAMLQRYEAVELFCHAAGLEVAELQARPALAGLVAGLCRQLGGLALAIALVGARLRRLGPGALDSFAAERLLWLQDPARSPRQQSLQAALSWSFSLLDAAGLALMQRLAVCVGGFSYALALRIASQDAAPDTAAHAPHELLDDLLERALICSDGGEPGITVDEPPRLRLLEPTRQFLNLRMDAPTLAAAQQAHARALRAQLAQAWQQAPTEPEDDWLARHGPDLPNVQQALRWSAGHDTALHLDLVAHAGPLFNLSYQMAAYRAASDATLAPDGAGQQALQALQALPLATQAAFWLSRSHASQWAPTASASEQCRCALLAHRLFAEAGMAMRAHEAACMAAVSLQLPAGQARTLLASPPVQPDWPPRIRRMRHAAEAFLAMQSGDHAEARLACRAALGLAREARATRSVWADLSNLAYLHLQVGDVDEAVRTGRELRAVAPLLGPLRVYALGNLLNALLRGPALGEARDVVLEFVDVARRSDWIAFDLFADVCALFAAREGRLVTAAYLAGFARRQDQQVQRFPALAAARGLSLQLIGAGLDAEAAGRWQRLGEAADRERVALLATDVSESMA
ncbi:MAG: winged helix-turn-helix domain-containing protein [Burkholderiaceae bacterium]|nr:winged helix-turn-helix domain-containing protein [Burkholderiaceae bacterium]